MKTTTKATHTPGPWNVDEKWPFEDDQGRRFDAVIKHCPNGDALICSFEHSVFRDEHTQNAQLISAAPDLLEAAKLGLAAMIAWGGRCEAAGEKILAEESRVNCETIRYAIAKAEGNA